MSQSATLYSISSATFQRLFGAPGIEEFESSQARSICTFQGTFMGLEFVLAKDQDEEDAQLAREIFNPVEMIGQERFDDASLYEEFDLPGEATAIPYLDPSTIEGINSFLQRASASDVENAYDADEMNDNGIYPGIWSDDDDDEEMQGKSSLVEDFAKLKSFMNQAFRDKDYVLVFVG